ncbi:unconventional myosin-XVIIIa [Galleria mellonella]|uniref:Unconventional myosin-XVIIIa n=1 Tax=Galleria mellonella TaxID=7137 RepID=A0ABM3MKS8_GALME|nr:unconventional myosin-XVIIIa [Galleria mellonella]
MSKKQKRVLLFPAAMFNFMKKTTGLAVGDTGNCEERDGEKERRKREKKERKEREKRERIAAGLEEPLRLEEVRRSLKLRGRRKEKEKLPSGITADYTASLFAHLEQDSNYSNYPLIPTSGSNSNLSDENNHLSPGYPATHNWNKKDTILQSDSSETSLNSLNNPNNANTSPRQPPSLPPIPPRPPKRGILKGPRLSNTSSNSQESNVQNADTVDYINGQDPNLLARNTQQNELISYGIPPSKSTSSSDDMQQLQNFTKKVIHSPVENQYKNYKNNSSNPSIVTQDVDEVPKTNGNSYLGVTSTSPSADSLTDTTTNSSFATPPFSTSPVGESQGFHRWSRTSNFEDVYLPLPPLTSLKLPKPRILTIQRQKAPRNDFGFSLRRAMVQERIFIGETKELNGHEENGLTNGENKYNGNITNGFISKLTHKAVILAEPGSYPGASETGLLPGDRLLEVNDVNVEGKSREEVIDLIKSSQDSVTIKVQPIAELCELSRRRAADGGGDVELSDSNVRGGTLSRSGSRRFTSTQAKSEEQLACEKEWLQTGHMWLAHRGGFTAVVREGDADAGRAKVRVIQTGEVITVDEDDLEKANPPQLEMCEDIASLRCLNECGALNVLRSRYAAGLPHARAGHALLVLGPPKRTAPIYTEKVAAMFRGCRADDMPPHVFAAAQSAHRCMLASRRDRAIVFLGRSGSGKTSAMRHCVWYLASTYPAQGSKLTPERFDAAFDVLHTFGSSRTGSNTHASRFVSLTSLDFDGGGALVSASVQTLLPDLRPGQAPLRALHTLFHGCDGRLRRELLLDQAPVNAPNPFISFSDKADAPTEFSALKEAMQLLNITEQEEMAVWKILAVICHLGWAGAVKASTGASSRYQFASTGCGQRAARLLSVGADELARAIFAGAVPSSPQNNSTLRTPSPSNEREVSGTEALDAFVTGLYNETFNIIVSLVNRSVSTSSRTSASLLLLDAPGADNPMCAGQQSGAPLSKLLSNYLQERLQAVFHEAMLVAPRERYSQEGITLDDGAEEDWLSETVNPGPMVELLDKSPQNTIVRSSQTDLRECDRRGLLWLLDEESMYPGSSDDTFLERVMTHYGAPHHTHYLIKKAPHARQFVLQHLQGTNPVLYDVTGWVKASREKCDSEEIIRLSCMARGAAGGGAGWAAAGDASTLRRASSIRRTLTTGTAGMKRRSTALQAKFVADGVVDTLRRCGAGGVHFVCCLLTNQAADVADDVNVPLLRSQFRGFQLLEAARLYKQGFPEHMPLSEFARRYRLLATSENETAENNQQTSLSDRQIVDDMLLALDLDVTSYRLGLTQIMFRGGVVGGLDARRDAALARVLVRLQARARGLLARRRAQRLRTQHTAARCVQRNVRAFLAVRDWPWWRLLVRVTPLLAVHRTEHRLKQAQEELESLRTKLEKVESERTHFKNETEKLETKLSEVGGELAEERAAAALATERADAEAAERLRVERDNRDLLANNQRLQQASERLELELLHWRSADSGGAEPSDSEGSEAEAGANADKYKRRYESAHRELQLLRAQLRRQHEDDLEQLVTVKKQLEKKVQDAYEEVEEQRAVAAQWKRKLQKMTNDMADLRSLLDEQTCRNNLLEKRQRKFDAELHGAQEELKRERAAKERLSRERDQAHADKYVLEQSLSEARLELELKEERLAAATRELEERGGGGVAGDEAAALRRARADLERRVRDQEEELDDLAARYSLLESSKLRLEMLLEQQRKEARLEAAARDDEMEETRANATKKLKMLESQLESEHAERSLLLRERHELERRLAALEEAARADAHDQAQLVQRLKRDLKRYRALLRDAQTMLEQKEKEGGGKAQIRQLKNQVEDLELAVRAATKAKQTAEAEAAETSAALEEATRARAEAADRALAAARDAAAARAQLDDTEEEAAELLKKYRSSTSALCAAQAQAREAAARADAAADEARQARERLAELAARLARAEAGHEHGHHEAERRLECRNKELESSLELEATARARVEGQLARLRDAHDQLAAELAAARARDAAAADDLRKLARQFRELKEENSNLNVKLSETARAKTAAEAAAAAAAAEATAARDEARLAARRATALQEAIAGDLSSPGDSRDTDSDNDSYSSDESIGTFLANHKLSPSAPSRNSIQLDLQKSQTPEGRQSRTSNSSNSGTKQLSPTKESFA